MFEFIVILMIIAVEAETLWEPDAIESRGKKMVNKMNSFKNQVRNMEVVGGFSNQTMSMDAINKGMKESIIQTLTYGIFVSAVAVLYWVYTISWCFSSVQ